MRERTKVRPRAGVEVYRLGLYDPLEPDSPDVQWVGHKVRGTRENLSDMRATVREYNSLAAKEPDVLLCLGIFTVGR